MNVTSYPDVAYQWAPLKRFFKNNKDLHYNNNREANPAN